MKIAVVGGGSTYAPELISGFVSRHGEVPVKEIWMTDTNKQRLEVVGGFCQRMARVHGDAFSIHLTTDLLEAVTNADYVILQIRVGGQEARHKDITLGLKHDIVGQETTGIGGFAKAMRTIPVVLDICNTIRQYSKPDVWVINFTNPSAIITQAITDYSAVKAIGLCNVPISLMYQCARVLNKAVDQLTFDYIGLNHLGWMRHVYENGKDRIDDIMRIWMDDPETFKISNVPVVKVSLLRSLNMIPSPYLQYFYFTRDVVAALKSKPKTRAQEVMEIDAELMKIYAVDEGVKLPELLKKRGGELYSTAAINLLSSLISNRGDVQIVNVQNQGAIQGLFDSDIVEVPAVITEAGARPIPLHQPEQALLGLMQHVKAYERQTVQAAVSRSYNDALWALASNPLVGELTIAEQCLTEMNQVFHLGLK